MDIRRLKLFNSRNAAMLTNDLVQLVVEDQGGMVLEFSAKIANGGRINPHAIPSYRGTGSSVYSDENSEFWQNNPTLYQQAGSYLVFPKEDEHSTAASYWMVEQYGTDSEFGGVWLTSRMRNRLEGWQVRKLDLLLPNQPVHYTAYSFTNNAPEALEATIQSRTLLGPPFLEQGCVVNTNAEGFESFPIPNTVSRIPEGQFNDWKKVQTKESGALDLSEIPHPTNTVDFIKAKLNQGASIGYTSLINPRMQMAYVNFFPSKPSDEDELVFTHSSFLYQLGGMSQTPYALYDGGLDQQYMIELGEELTTTLESHQTKMLFHARSFSPYDNARLGGNFHSLEQNQEGILLKRTKTTALIPADPTFQAVRTLAKRFFEE